MGSEVAPRVLEGRAFNGGVAQSVARSQGLVRITLTVMSGHPAGNLAEGESGEVAFEPVPVAAGERVAIVLRWAHGSEECAGPVLMPCDSVLRCAHVRR